MTTQDIADGESVEVQGSAAKPYILKNTGGVYSCTCPAWRNQVARHREAGPASTSARPTAATTPRRNATGGALLRQVGRAARPRTRQPQQAQADPARAPLGERRRPRRLVDEREARRRPRLLGRVEDLPLPAGERVPRLPTGSSSGPGRRHPLDGELWLDRKCVPEDRSASSAGRTRADHWQQVKYVLFDAPAHRRRSFEDRVAYVRHLLDVRSPTPYSEYVQRLDHIERCRARGPPPRRSSPASSRSGARG